MLAWDLSPAPLFLLRFLSPPYLLLRHFLVPKVPPFPPLPIPGPSTLPPKPCPPPFLPTCQEYHLGIGITFIDMSVGNVKEADRRSFDLTTPYRIFR